MMRTVARGLRPLSAAICCAIIAHVSLLPFQAAPSSSSWLQVHVPVEQHGRMLRRAGPKVPGAGAMYYGPRTARIDNASFIFLDGEDMCCHSCEAVANRIVITDGMRRPCGIYEAYHALAKCGALAFVFLPLW